MNWVNSICYTAGWFWCVLLGIRGHGLLAVIGALLLIIFQLYYTKRKNESLYIQDLLLVLFSIPLGFILETLLIQTRVLAYVNSNGYFPPFWILSLYPLFSLVVNHSLKFIKKNLLLPFVLGFFGAPLSYFAGHSLNGVIFFYLNFITWCAIGVFWGVFLCFLVKLSMIIEKATLETLKDRDSSRSVKLLYDGDCPLCKNEICHLQTKSQKIHFVNIASEYKPLEHKNISYETAMLQMHAIDDEGNILTGLDAFAAIYARSQLLVLSTFIRIPFIRALLAPLYRLFAKQRLWITGRKDG